MAVANANIGAGFLYFLSPQTNLANFRCSSRVANVINDINLNITDMNKFTEAIGRLIVAIDNAIYKSFGIVTPLRKSYWAKRSKKIQLELDKEHWKRDRYNYLKGTNYTTKEAVRLYNREVIY